MPENYEVTSVRETTDVDTDSGDLLDYVEAHAKTIPHGIAISVRVPAKNVSADEVKTLLAAKATELERIHSEF